MGDWGGYNCPVCWVTEWYEQTNYNVSGPESLEYPTDKEAVFEIERTGSEIDYDEVEWIFSYKDRDDEWISIHKIGKSDLSLLKIDGDESPSFNDWNLLMADNAELGGNYYALEMSVVVDFYCDGQKVSSTNTHNFLYKSKIELRLSVTSQTVISPDIKEVTFFLSGEGVGKDLVRWTDWHFSYKNKQDQWIDLDPLILEEKLTSITVNETGGDISLDHWFDLAEDQGIDHEGGKLLEMRVFVKAYSNDETLFNTSNTHSFSLETESESYRITGFGVPLILMNVQLKRDGETFSTSIDESGYLTVPSRFLTLGDYEIELYFSLKVEEIIHFNIVDKEGPVKIVMEIQDNKITKMRLVVVPGTTEADLEIVADSLEGLRLEKYFTGDKEWLATYIKLYIHFTEAKIYYESVLNEEVRLNLPLEISPFVPNVNYPMYIPNVGIAIDKHNSLMTSRLRPNMEYHEFSHYAMHSIYGQFPKPPVSSIEEKNHGGYINPSTADSYIEGFAHFMSMIINEHYGDQWNENPEISSPDIYGPFGSLELNYKAWEKRGKAEELAIAGILWDLYDGEKHEEARIEVNKELAKDQWNQLLYEADLNNDGVIENREIIIHSVFKPITIEVHDRYFYMYDPDKNGDGALDKQELTMLYGEYDPEDLPASIPQTVDAILNYDTEPKDGKLTFKELVEATRKERLKLVDKTPKNDKIPEQMTFEDILKELEKKFVENDGVSLSLKELWAILRTYKNDFTVVYNALISAYGEKKDAIDEIFKSHGFWIDENIGNLKWDRKSEPIRDTVDDGRLDEKDYFIDYPSAGFIYDENEIIGSSGNYQRMNRTSIVYFPGHFIKGDNSVPSYTVTIGVFTNPDLFGLIPDQIYKISCQNIDGYLFVPVPPESYNSTISVVPDEVEAKIPLIFTSKGFEEHYDESIEQGYFREHN